MTDEVKSLAALEQEAILRALTHYQGNRSRTASALGLSVRALRDKLKAYENAGIPIPPAVPGRRPKES